MENFVELIKYALTFVVAHAPEFSGIILPPIVDFISKDVTDEKERFIVTILVCLGIATILKWDSISYGSPEEIFAAAALIFAESQAVFKLYFKSSFVRAKIQQRLGVPLRVGEQGEVKQEVETLVE